MVRIRMSRMGRIHRPFFRINAVEKKSPRDGKILEQLGWYDPVAKDPTKQLELNVERIKHWLSVGAQPSDTVNDILAQKGLIDADKWKAKRAGRVKKKIADTAKAKVVADEAEKVKVAADDAEKAKVAAADAEKARIAAAAAAEAAPAAEEQKEG